jgi:hypothetical protein
VKDEKRLQNTGWKPEGKKSVKGYCLRLGGYIKIGLKEIGWEIVDWIHLAQNMNQWRAVVTTVVNPRVPQNAMKFLTSSATTSFSRMALLRGIS